MLTDQQIKCCFTFAKKCTSNVFKRVFQYKIGVGITPTCEYLYRYKVLDSNKCTKCEDEEVDTIIHCLWDCSRIQQFLTRVLENITTWNDREENITMEEYLFGVSCTECDGINHYLLEAKMFIFYNWIVERETAENAENRVDNEETESKMTRFHCIVRRVIKTEKHIALGSHCPKKLENFYQKWGNFGEVYQIYGPDNL